MLQVKWPNDLLLGAKKLAGILIEGDNEPCFSLAIGIGVNCAAHPAESNHPATDLAEAGALVAPERLLAALMAAMARRLAQWRRGEGFGSIRADWLKRAAGLGRDIRVRLPEGDLTGRFDGLDATGRLLLAAPDGVTAIAAGEVFGL